MPWPADLARLPARHLRALANCDAIAEELPLVVDGSRRPSAAMSEHLRTCLRCQAELAGYRRLLRVLRGLRDEPVAFPAPDMMGDALRALQDRLGALEQQVVSRQRRAGGQWVIAGSVAAIGIAALWAGAAAARASRSNRSAVVA
ncbi:MAG TPA: hypothetical protein VL984_00145 [Acidimicrobiales bacterium]|nr:hypothetical protein [Acidimicrobiales bacterium]